MTDAKVTYTLSYEDKIYIIENVPARVCEETGEQYFAPVTVEHIHEIIKSRKKPDKVIETPVCEYKDGVELVTAFRGTVGIGLSSLDSAHRDVLFREMEDLKKRRKATLGCNMYRLTFSKYESFGEWVYVIKIHRGTEVRQRLQRTS